MLKANESIPSIVHTHTYYAQAHWNTGVRAHTRNNKIKYTHNNWQLTNKCELRLWLYATCPPKPKPFFGKKKPEKTQPSNRNQKSNSKLNRKNLVFEREKNVLSSFLCTKKPSKFTPTKVVLHFNCVYPHTKIEFFDSVLCSFALTFTGYGFQCSPFSYMNQIK